MTGTPGEVRRWLSEISQRRKVKRGGRKQTKPADDLKAKAKREYMRAYRKKKKKAERENERRKDDEKILQDIERGS